MKKIVLLVMVLCASIAFAAMTSKTVSIPAGDTCNLVEEVPWPVDAACARFNPPAKVNGTLSTFIGFCVNSTVMVEGPTTVTLEYGTPEPK